MMKNIFQRTVPSALLLLSPFTSAFTTPQRKQPSLTIASVSRGSASAGGGSYYDQGWQNIPDPVLSSTEPSVTTVAKVPDLMTPPPAVSKVVSDSSSALQDSASQLASSVKAAAASATDAITFPDAASKLTAAAQASTRAAQDRLSTTNLESSARAVLENARALQSTPIARDHAPAISLPHPTPLPHTEFDQILANAPDTPGLAQPLVQYVMDTLYAARDSPLNPPNLLANMAGSTPADGPVHYETVALGLQVQSELLEKLRDNSHTAQQAADYFTRNLAASYDTSSHTLHDLADQTQHAAAAASTYMGTNAAQSYAHSVEQWNAVGAPAVAAAQSATREWQAKAAASAAQLQTNALASASTTAEQRVLSPLAQATRHTAQYVTEQLERLVASLSSSSTSAMVSFAESDKLLAGAALGLVVLVTLLQQQQQSTNNNKLAPAKNGNKKKSALVRGKPITVDDVEQDKLEGVVADLTQAVAILANELKDIKQNQADAGSTENDPALAAKLMELEAQNVALRSQLNAAQFEVETLAEVNEALNVSADAIQAVSDQKSPMPPAAGPDKNLANAYFVLAANGVINGGDAAAAPKRKKRSVQGGGLAEQQS